ncbi:MAG: helix-turn-helix domain-containing protein [Rhodospirillales bacterium]|nr:helix-turn-helix domain-containing protein [Rhodospirillales bacterium]
MRKPYHYTECGLDYVYLLDGFRVIRTEYGPAVRVINASELDRAIAMAIIRRQKKLTGQEVRLLRGLLDMTQEELGRALGKDAQSVARWEKGKTELPATEDIAIRQIYLEKSGHRPRFIDTSREVGELKKRVGEVKFKIKGRHTWSVAA